MKLLIVEDARVMAQSLLRQLATLGIRDTHLVGSAEDALDALRERTFDAILLDWMLPQMSGYDLLKTLRGTRRYAQTPIVMMTSNDDRSDVLDAFKAGATDYIVKPFAPDLLAEKMEALARRCDVAL